MPATERARSVSLPLLSGSRLLEVDEVAFVLRMGPEQVRRLIKRGELPARRSGRTWRVTSRDLDAYIAVGPRVVGVTPLTVRECASSLGVTTEWVRRAIADGVTAVQGHLVRLKADTTDVNGRRIVTRVYRDQFKEFLDVIGWRYLSVSASPPRPPALTTAKPAPTPKARTHEFSRASTRRVTPHDNARPVPVNAPGPKASGYGHRRRLSLKGQLDEERKAPVVEADVPLPIPKHVPWNRYVPGTIALSFFTHWGFHRS
jgi:excisionase family DNA binding protein